MGNMENKILNILNKTNGLDEAVEWETIGGPTPGATLKGPLDYAKNVKQAQVPSAPGHIGAYPIPGVGTIGVDKGEENEPITDVIDDMDEDEDHDDDHEDHDDDKDHDDETGAGKDDEIEETFASLLARLAEDEEGGETSLEDADDDFGTPDETLPDVDSRLEDPDELATEAPGAKKPGGVEEDETYTEPEETLVGDEIDSMTDEPEKLVTQAPGAKAPESEDGDSDEDEKKDVEEDIKAIFSGVKLSESGRAKATMIFQAAVARRVTEEKHRVQYVATKKLKEAFDVLKTRFQKKQGVYESTLTTQVDQYLNYVVENWMTENRLAVERGIRAELAEDFITGLKKLFVEHYIEVPESKVDVVSTLGNKVTKLEAKLNETVEANVKMRASLNAYRKEEVVRVVSGGLPDTQRDKLKKLAEGVDYTTRKEFAEELQSLKESYFPKRVTPATEEKKPLVEETQTTTSPDPSIDAAVKTIAKMNRR